MPSELPYSDQEIIRLIARGDEAAFALLFDRHRNRIFSVGLKISRSVSIAEEIVQDVFLKIWVKRSALAEVKDFNAYLFIVTRNEVYQTLNRIARQKQLNSEAVGDLDWFHNDTEATVLNKNYNTLLQQAISRLSPQQQQVYRLIREQGLKREEAAARLGLHPETVKTHLAQAMRNIRAFLKGHIDIYIALLLLYYRS